MEMDMSSSINSVDQLSIGMFDSESRLMLYEPAKKSWYPMQGLHEELIKNYFTAVVNRDHIYALMVTQKVYRLEYTNVNSAWQQLPSMNVHHGCKPPTVSLGDFLYVIGGDKLPMTTGERFDLSKNMWIMIRDMNVRRSAHAIVAVKGSVYCIGGENGIVLNSVERYDPERDAWIPVESMNQARHRSCAVELSGKIYVMGGIFNKQKLSDVECYDITTNMWAHVSRMQNPRSWFSACAAGNNIYAVGDEDEIGRGVHTIEVFDTNINEWSVIEERSGMRIWAAVPLLNPFKVPEKPEDVKAEKRNAGFVVSWNKPLSNGLTYSIKVFCENEELEQTHFRTSELEYRFESPKLSKKYFFEVRAINRYGFEGEKTTSNVITSYRRFHAGNGVYYDVKLPLRKKYKVFHGEMERHGVIEDVAVKILESDINHTCEKEIKNMEKLIKHENTVLYKTSGTIHGKSGISSYIVMELCDTKTLYEIIKEEQLSDEKLKLILLHITCGLKHMHERGLIHRDVKPQNVLRSLDGRLVKLTDFGLSKVLDPDRSIVSKSTIEIGTDGWGSPEHYMNETEMSKKSDIYSGGLLFYFVLSKGDHVFGNDFSYWKRRIIEGFRIDLSRLQCRNVHQARDLISHMLSRDQHKRPTAEQILTHPYFTSNQD